MRKNLFKAFILCTLIPSMWLSAANAVGEDAECLSFITEAGATFTLCLEGDVNKAKLTNKTKSEILELARQLKSGAVVETKAKARNFGYGGMDSDYSESYQTTQPEFPTTPDYTDYYDNYTVEEPEDNSVTPEVNEPDPYDMCAMYPSYPGCSS